MPSLEMTGDEIAILLAILALVWLPSRLSWLGNLLGRMIKGPPHA